MRFQFYSNELLFYENFRTWKVSILQKQVCSYFLEIFRFTQFQFYYEELLFFGFVNLIRIIPKGITNKLKLIRQKFKIQKYYDSCPTLLFTVRFFCFLHLSVKPLKPFYQNNSEYIWAESAPTTLTAALSKFSTIKAIKCIYYTVDIRNNMSLRRNSTKTKGSFVYFVQGCVVLLSFFFSFVT